MQNNAAWYIQLLGGLQARRGEQAITRFPSRKTAALLAYLAYFQNRTHSREALIERLWPECDLTAGRGRLATLLTFLRHLLEPPGTPPGAVVQADRLTVRLHPATLRTDVAEFEGLLAAAQAQSPADRIGLLERAIACYGGDLLPEYYEDWIASEQSRLSQRYADALEQLSGEYERGGDWERALATAQHSLQADPYREESYRAVMRLQAALGRPGAGLETYRQLERLLKVEMCARPALATRDLADLLQSNPDAVSSVRPLSPAPKVSATSTTVIQTAPLPTRLPASQPPLCLPLPLTRYFGREAEIQRLTVLLQPGSSDPDAVEVRLVTLTGPGGTGKTRLAIETARRLAREYANRVWFVSLADLTDPLLIPGALLSALQLAPTPQADPLERIGEALAGAPALLILDNLEHLLDEMHAAPPASGAKGQGGASLLLRLLLERLPRLKCLITSRRSTGIGGEREFAVLALPVPSTALSPQDLLAVESVALYVDRAQAARPDFALTGHNTEDVATLCRRLEGVPLAIEMAAGWAKQLTPARMLERLETQLDMLVSRRADVSARHRSLRATIAWSYDLLGAGLRDLFARLSVFRGGWSLEAAEWVCAETGKREKGKGKRDTDPSFPWIEDAEVLDLLSSLVDKSLVLVEERDGSMRYRMLETIREYAAEKLTESGEEERLRSRHCAWCVELAEEAALKLKGSEQGEWLERLEAEHDNLRAALAWSLEAGKREQGKGKRDTDPSFPFSLPSFPLLEEGLRLCGALSRFWQVRGHLREGHDWCQAALEAAGAQGRTVSRAKVLHGAGRLAEDLSDYTSAQTYYEECLAISQEIADQDNIAAARMGLGNVAYNRGDYASARACYEVCLAIWREIGDQRNVGASLHNLGYVARDQGDYVAAQAYFQECLTDFRGIGDRWGMANALHGLGNVAFALSEFASAQTYYQECLTIFREIGDRRRVAYMLNALGFVAHNQSDDDSARACYAECLVIYQEVGDRRGIAYALESFADMAATQALAVPAPVDATSISENARFRLRRAIRLWRAAQDLREAIGSPQSQVNQAEQEQEMAAVRERLGEAEWEAEWNQGSTMTLEQAIAYALDPFS